MNECGIYRLDFPNGYFYFGSSKQLSQRFREHQWDLARKSHCNKKMQRVFNKYGEYAVTVLHQTTEWTRLQWEQSYLDEWFGKKLCLNLSPLASGGGNRKGTKQSDATREKIGAATKGVPKSVEHRAKISAALKKVERTDAHCLSISNSRKGKPLTPAQLAQLARAREARAARRANEEVIP